MKIVVTGASGFLGRHVLAELRNREDVIIIPVSTRDIAGSVKVTNYSDSPGGDVLIHLAEDGDRKRVANAGAEYEKATNATLVALLAKKYQRILYTSSAVLYGDSSPDLHFPSDRIFVNDAYSRIKRNSELAVLASSGGIVGRIANVFGHGMSENNVLNAILKQIPGIGSVKVMDARPVRDFLWAKDAAAGIVALALDHNKNDNSGGVFNLGTGLGTSIGSLVHVALEIVGQPDREVESLFPSDRRSSLILDYSETEAACRWRPETPLRMGLLQLMRVRKLIT